MSTVTKYYLEMCRVKLTEENGKRATDYALCKKLGISSSAMTNYTKHNREADDSTATKIAQYLEVPVFKIIAQIHQKTAKTPQEKGIWSALLSSAVTNDNSEHCILC